MEQVNIAILSDCDKYVMIWFRNAYAEMIPKKRIKNMISGLSGKKKLKMVAINETKNIPRIPNKPNVRYAGKVMTGIIFCHRHIFKKRLPYPHNETNHPQ
jgi:hypothetical protein